MISIPDLKIGSRVTLAGPSGQEVIYLIHAFDPADSWPIGRPWMLGNWGMCNRMPFDNPACRLVSVEPPRPPVLTDSERISNARAALRAHYVYLGELPHPAPTRAARGETLADYLVWCFSNAGINGKLKAAAILEDAITNRGTVNV
ncbi:MAG TPA: hypothetical protein VNU68_07245 [Verrucomicrobiae bacterium]|nr:hypothetical protein [Verrucomicrobiae bacterium]